MDLNPTEDPLRNGTFSGTVTAANFVPAGPPGVSNTNTWYGLSALASVTSGAKNSAFGNNALALLTTANLNVAVGYDALAALVTGNRNIAIGANAGLVLNGGTSNIMIGQGAAAGLTTGNSNVAIGEGAFSAATVATDSVALGAAAGKYDVSGNPVFYLNTFDQSTTAGDKANSLMYGVFNALPASQTLAINAVVTITQGSLVVPGGAGNNLLSLTASPTNGAAASLGTLTNAPVAGNPTKWYPVNDAGTIRYIPLW